MSLFIGREAVLEKCLQLDSDVANTLDYSGRHLRVLIVGGSALVILEAISRSTADIDVIDAANCLTDYFEGRGINTNVNAYISNFPYNYLDRIVKVDIVTKMIDFYTLSIEDIAVSKLYSPRPKDYSDICDAAASKKINWTRLHKLIYDPDEAKASALNEFRYKELVSKYEDFERRFCT